MSPIIQGSIRTAFRKLAVAIAMTLFFALLGMFGKIGYDANFNLSVAIIDNATSNLTVVVQSTFNPILHPFHWLTGHGSWLLGISGLKSGVNGGPNFAGQHAFSNWRYVGRHEMSQGMFQTTFRDFLSAEDYYNDAAMKMATWGFLENFFVLLAMAVIIEIVQQRALYVMLLAGIIGFIAGIIGTVVGLAIGAALFIVSKSHKDLFSKMWNYLLERDDHQTL